MARKTLRRLPAACALVLCAVALGACGEEEPGLEEPAREGLSIDVAGLEYNVFITRQLNLNIPPDKAYYEGPPAPPGEALYGLFIQVCNPDGEPARSTSSFAVADNQGNEFKPITLPEDNAFAYQPREIAEEGCIPEVGSLAASGPTAGSLLLFEFPIEATENRPLELIIRGPFNALRGERETKRVELDL